MSAIPHAPATTRQHAALADWIVPLLRASIAVLLGIVVTFSPDHSAAFGLGAFAAFALVTGAVQSAGVLAARRSHRGWSLAMVQGAVTLVAGVAAAVVPPDAAVLVAIVSAWAILSGAVEFVAGMRARRRETKGLTPRDAMTAGVLAALLGAVLLIVPPDYRQPWSVVGDAGVVEASGAVTASVMAVGILGAWAIIHGVILAIAAISARRPQVDAEGAAR